MALSLSGDERLTQAQKVAVELRRDFHVEAWVHDQEIDLTEQTTGLGVDMYGKPKRMKNMRGGAAREAVVLVGSYKAADDPEAVRTLEKLRTAKIKALSGVVATPKSELNALRNFYLASSQRNKAKQRGLLGRAFITRNPLLPADEMASVTLDPFIVELNQGVEHSLLKNPAQFTVVVGTFRGAAAYSEKNYDESVNKGSEAGISPIDKAAINAMLVAAKLRQEGHEAYVFHDRHESLVTVGSFDEVGTEMPDGHIELQRGIASVMKKFEAQKTSNLNQLSKGQVGLVPVTIAVVGDNKKTYNVPLDVSPRLIQVPRQSIADVYRER